MASDSGGGVTVETGPVVIEGSSESWAFPSLENPFTVKVGQVFTGFGVGCGVGIGVGRPINIGAIPALQQVLSATRGATDVFSGAGRHVNSSLKKLGLRNIEAGIGCGVGFGHGFGAGFAIKPSAIQRLQIFCAQVTAKVMAKLGVGPSFPAIHSGFPTSIHGSKDAPSGSLWSPLKTASETARSDVSGLQNNWTTQPSENVFSSPRIASRTEKVISSFLQNPVLTKEAEQAELNELAEKLRSENNVLQLVLKHQKTIDELVEENQKLRKVLVEELNVAPSKLQSTSDKRFELNNPCSKCFECRRKSRSNR